MCKVLGVFVDKLCVLQARRNAGDGGGPEVVSERSTWSSEGAECDAEAGPAHPSGIALVKRDEIPQARYK